MRIENLKEKLAENGWEYTVGNGRIEITNPHFGTRKEYPLQVVMESSLQNILLPHFLEACYRHNRDAAEEWE